MEKLFVYKKGVYVSICAYIYTKGLFVYAGSNIQIHGAYVHVYKRVFLYMERLNRLYTQKPLLYKGESVHTEGV